MGLGPGEILRIEPGDPGRTEYLIVLSVTGSSDPTQPAQVTLRYPGRVDHRPGARVERVTAAAPGADNNLISDAIPGDAVVLSSALTGMTGAATIEIDDGGPDPEYHTVYSVFRCNRSGRILPPARPQPCGSVGIDRG